MGKFEHEFEIIAASGLFDREWYLAEYPDVAALGMDPIEHYLWLGAQLHRRPAPTFDTSYYLQSNPDVVAMGINPFLHYATHGKLEGRLPAPGSDKVDPHLERAVPLLKRLAQQKLQGEPKRFFPHFDRDIESRFLEEIDTIYSKDRAEIDGLRASIIMPTYNRASTILHAIGSIQKQTHQLWELLLVDDGSTDGTQALFKRLPYSSKIRIFVNNHQGVSAARNTGLEAATGEIIFYLDSDNRWAPNFLRTMITYMRATGAKCAYSGICVLDESGNMTGYRGEPFNWDECLAANYIDINAFCHSYYKIADDGSFDQTLRRMVDWDLILRYTKRSGAAYAPFVGCYYSDSKTDAGRITIAQPYVYRFIVQAKNKFGLSNPKQVSEKLSLRFCIKIPAPFHKRNEWGDFHYADSLKSSLESFGHKARIEFLGDWYKHSIYADDVVIVLRGLTAYEPRAGQVNILWNISHPDQVSYDEYGKYDLVFVASLSYSGLLSEIIGKKVKALLQCSDQARFPYHDADYCSGDRVLFIGNSRNEYRTIVKWAIEAGERIDIFGSRWEKFVPKELIRGNNLENKMLHTYYSRARAVLNDHWQSMQEFGFISNRLFDIVSCGGNAVSDCVPSVSYVFGDSVAQVSSPKELSDTLAIKRSSVSPAYRKRASQFVQAHHSFGARAEFICNEVFSHLGLLPSERSPAIWTLSNDGTMRRKVGLLLQRGLNWPTSSGFIRLVAPLSGDAMYKDVEAIVLDGPDDPRIDQCAACIVQRVSIGDMVSAEKFVERLRAGQKRLFIDNDDAFCYFQEYLKADQALKYLMSNADEVWFSTENLRTLYFDTAPRSMVIPNCLDPRLWKDYRHKDTETERPTKLRLLYMGTATHDADFAILLPALDRLHSKYPDKFDLTIIGAVRTPPVRSWLRIVSAPRAEGSYPRFVRWLTKQGPFDIGLAPLVDNGFNVCKSDIKVLDYCALGLVSIVSDLQPYQEVIRRGLAISGGSTAETWFAALEAVSNNISAYIELLQQATCYVWRERHCSRSGRLMAERMDAAERKGILKDSDLKP